jgi:hypothetical protein
VTDAPILVEDDLLHPRNDDPYWNESTYLPILIPEAGVHGGIYFHHRPNMKLSAGGPHFWDATGDDIYSCLHWDWNPTQAMPEGAQMYDFALDNTLTVRTVKLQQTYDISYAKGGCEVDLRWDAVLEPVGLRHVGGKANPAFEGFIPDTDGELSTGHYDHLGRVTGTVIVEGRTHQVDCLSMRDHSWGPRRLVPIRIGYSWAAASHLFHAPSRSTLPIDEDPVIGTVESVPGGFYVRDGVRAEFRSGTRTITERAADGRPVREVIDTTDELGRTLHAKGTNVMIFKWTAHTDWFDWYGLTEWRFDGTTAWGETHDFYPFAVQRRLHRALRASAG